MTEREFIINESQCFPGGSIKISALQRLMQTLATDDSDRIGCTYEALRALNTVFVITKLALKLSSPVLPGDNLKIVTYSNKVGGITFIRNYVFYKNGVRIGNATTEWVLVRFDTRSIVRPRDIPFVFESVGNEEETLALPRSLASGEAVFCGKREVKKEDLDSNLHMNNCVYSDVALERISFDTEKTYPREVYIIFRHEARLGEMLELSVSESGNEKTVSAYNSTVGTACFEFKAIFDDIIG